MLARDHDVTVVAAMWDDSDQQDLAALHVNRTVGVRMSRGRAAARAVRAVLTGDSLQRAFLASPELTRAMRTELERGTYDLGYLNVLRTTHLRRYFAEIPCLLDLDEYRSAFYEQMARTSRNPAWRVVAGIEARRMRHVERDLDRQYGAVMLSAPSDAPPQHPVRTLVRSPHALTTPAPGDPTITLDGRSILFVGRLSYRANTEAISWFVRSVLPGVVERHPDAHLYVVGSSPTRGVRLLAGPTVTVLGEVPDVTPYYAAAQVSIVPVQLATGVQMKLIESLASGIPTVATPVTTAQAGVLDEEHCLVAQNAEQWVTQVCRLLDDAELRSRLSARGHAWALEAYDPESIARSLRLAVDRTVR